MYLPDTELGVIEDVVGSGELGEAAVGREHGLDLADHTALINEGAAVLVGSGVARPQAALALARGVERKSRLTCRYSTVL
jgi:hypothetical protein